MDPLPAALTSPVDPLVFVDGLGGREPLHVTSRSPGPRRVRLVVRAVDNPEHDEWFIAATADIPARKARLPGRIEITSRSVEISWGGSILHPRIDQFTIPNMTTPALLIVDLFDQRDDVIGQSVIEFRTIRSQQLVALVDRYALETQSGAASGPLLSLARFYESLETIREKVSGRRVFVSGCGTGGELMVLAAMGAQSVVGSELDGTVLELATLLTEGNDRITVVPTTEAESFRGAFDLALSRHVVEHLPFADRPAYLAHLLSSVRVGGLVLVEFPNQDCPVEPHTGLEFFHWLEPVERQRAVEYFRLRAEAGEYPEDRAQLFASVGDHRNVSLDEFRTLVPSTAILSSVRHFDTAFMTDHPAASTIECILTRRS